MIHPFNATKVFKTIGRLLGKEIGEELTSKRGVKELAKILTLRSAEITEKFREQAKRLSKVSKDFSYQMMLE